MSTNILNKSIFRLLDDYASAKTEFLNNFENSIVAELRLIKSKVESFKAFGFIIASAYCEDHDEYMRPFTQTANVSFDIEQYNSEIVDKIPDSFNAMSMMRFPNLLSPPLNTKLLINPNLMLYFEDISAIVRRLDFCFLMSELYEDINNFYWIYDTATDSIVVEDW